MDYYTPTSATPSAYICPISHQIMKFPVMDSHGITFDKENILKWLETHDTNPMTGTTSQFVYNGILFSIACLFK